MNFPNEVSCSILIDPRDLGNVIGGKNSIDPRDLTVLPDGFHPLGHGFVADVMMEFASAGCAGENGRVWGLSFDRKERGAYAVAGFHPERAAYDPRRREHVSRCPILLEQDGSGNIAFRHPGTVPDRLIDNFIPAMKRCDVSGGGPTPGIEDAPEGATVRATRPGDINISFPALAERAQAAALATACGATTAAGNRL